MNNNSSESQNIDDQEKQLDLSFEFIFKTTAKLCRAYTVNSDEDLYNHDPISERVKHLSTDNVA